MLDSADSLRLAIFIGILVIMLSWETILPHNAGLRRRDPRWRNNLLLSVINTFAAKLLGPITAVAAASFANEHQFGVFNWLPWPAYLEVFIAVLLLDLGIYLQHLLAHKWHWFWRLHRVHHADIGYDVTTAVRFHPLEILLSIGIKVVLVSLLGVSATAVIVFEIILNGMAMFNHGNVSIPQPFERILRLLLVTPDMHRIHHSTIPKEHHSNFGFNISIWDRLFATYTKQSAQQPIEIGLTYIAEPALHTKLVGMLKIPFKKLR